CFFFQEEDGIRVFHVTGVQTCALPIFIQKVEGIAASKNATASQIALAWVLAKGDDMIPIPGTKREKYLIENLDAIKINLTPEEKIGRASCRERGEEEGEDERIKKE